MLENIEVDVVREKSFDPTFCMNVNLETDTCKISNVHITVVRRAPKVTFAYPDVILEKLNAEDFPKLELEIMNRILHFIMQSSDRKNVVKANRF